LQQPDAQKLLSELDPGEAGRMVRELPPPVVARLAKIMTKGDRESVLKHAEFKPESVGALMRGRFVTLDPRWSCKQAIERIQLSTRLRRVEETHLDTLMVVDEGKLIGVIQLKELVVAPRDLLVHELMDETPRTLSPDADQEEAVKLFTRYKLKSAPVVSGDGELLGVVVYKDIFEVASEETEEDFAKMAGVGKHEVEHSALSQAKTRLPWLIITCIGGLGVSYVVRHFEHTLAQIIALATFSPLIAGMGGNVGSQTATIVVRAIATNEMPKGGPKKLVLMEITVGVLLGLFYGVVLAFAAYVLYGDRYGYDFSVVIGVAMFFAMTVSSILASVEPFILIRMGADPATATGPLITTITDLLSNLLYFTLASWLLLRHHG
jgi:magnesium transporter